MSLMFTVILLLVSSLLFSYKWGKIEKSHSNPLIFNMQTDEIEASKHRLVCYVLKRKTSVEFN